MQVGNHFFLSRSLEVHVRGTEQAEACDVLYTVSQAMKYSASNSKNRACKSRGRIASMKTFSASGVIFFGVS